MALAWHRPPLPPTRLVTKRRAGPSLRLVHGGHPGGSLLRRTSARRDGFCFGRDTLKCLGGSRKHFCKYWKIPNRSSPPQLSKSYYRHWVEGQRSPRLNQALPNWTAGCGHPLASPPHAKLAAAGTRSRSRRGKDGQLPASHLQGSDATAILDEPQGRFSSSKRKTNFHPRPFGVPHTLVRRQQGAQALTGARRSGRLQQSFG